MNRSQSAGPPPPGPDRERRHHRPVPRCLTWRTLASLQPTAVFTDFWTGARAAAGV